MIPYTKSYSYTRESYLDMLFLIIVLIKKVTNFLPENIVSLCSSLKVIIL